MNSNQLIRNVGIAAFLIFVGLVSDFGVRYKAPLPDNVFVLSESQIEHCSGESIGDASLPDSWRAFTRDGLICGRYNLFFDAPESTEDLAVLIPTYRYRIRLKFNGHLLIANPHSSSTVSPLYHDLPSTLFHPESNDIEIEIFSSAGDGFLDEVYVGSRNSLMPLEKRLRFWRLNLPQWLTIIVVLFACLSLTLFIIHGQSVEYLYFSLFCISWSILILNIIWLDPFIPIYIWSKIIFIGMLTFATFGCASIASILDLETPIQNRILSVLWVIISCCIIILPRFQALFFARYILGPYALLLAVVTMFLFFRAMHRKPLSNLNVLYLALNLSVVVTGFHDAARVISQNRESIVYHLHFSATILMICIGSNLIVRYFNLLMTEQNFSSSLQRELAEERKKLAVALDREKTAIEKSAALKERDNLMRDLHDSLGARLISLVRLSEQDSVSQSLAKETLNELRFMTAPLRIEDCDIVTLLATFREKRLRHLEDKGLTVNWHVEALEDDLDWNTAQAMEFLRLLDELLGNALKHSTDDTISIRLFQDERTILKFENACSDAKVELASGIGLRNLNIRSKRLGADFTQRTNDGEFCAKLVW